MARVWYKDVQESPDTAMFDPAILTLQRENAELREQLAALTYGPRRLNDLLAQVNDTGLTEVCQCPGCYIARRFSELNRVQLLARLKNSINQRQCTLRKCLLWQCDQLGLTHETYRYDDTVSNFELDMDSGEDGWAQIAARMDCHLVVVDKGDGLWNVEYGRKLTETSLVINPETEKLKQLFALLDSEFGEDFFMVDGVDYFTEADNRG